MSTRIRRPLIFNKISFTTVAYSVLDVHSDFRRVVLYNVYHTLDLIHMYIHTHTCLITSRNTLYYSCIRVKTV